MQIMYALFDGDCQQLELPSPETFVLPGIAWGTFDELFTPAYWRGQAWQHQWLGTYGNFRLGRTLAEEVAACLMGGYGMPAELGLAAYSRLCEAGLLTTPSSAMTIEAALSEPFTIRGSSRRYRFARQKSHYLSGCLERLATFNIPDDDVEFRDRLADLPGIGLKTASWIVRNYRASNRVAIIDVHILRACRYIGLFPEDADPQRRYRDLEQTFLEFANGHL